MHQARVKIPTTQVFPFFVGDIINQHIHWNYCDSEAVDYRVRQIRSAIGNNLYGQIYAPFKKSGVSRFRLFHRRQVRVMGLTTFHYIHLHAGVTLFDGLLGLQSLGFGGAIAPIQRHYAVGANRRSR